MLGRFLIIGCFVVPGLFQSQAQQIIHLKNPSFELDKEPESGTTPKFWVDLGHEFETPPDIQPGMFKVDLPAVHGTMYLGMVVRDNGTSESVGQELESFLMKDSSYTVTLSLARSAQFVSLSRKTGQQASYTQACILQIFGKNTTDESYELLGETFPVRHTEWRDYDFELRPIQGSYNFLQLKAEFIDGPELPYNGNIMIDNISPIVQKSL